MENTSKGIGRVVLTINAKNKAEAKRAIEIATDELEAFSPGEKVHIECCVTNEGDPTKAM